MLTGGHDRLRLETTDTCKTPKVHWYPILTRALRHNLRTTLFLKLAKFRTFSRMKNFGR